MILIGCKPIQEAQASSSVNSTRTEELEIKRVDRVARVENMGNNTYGAEMEKDEDEELLNQHSGA